LIRCTTGTRVALSLFIRIMLAVGQHEQIFPQHAQHVPKSRQEPLQYPFLRELSSAPGGGSAGAAWRWTGPVGQGMVGGMPGGAGQFRLDEGRAHSKRRAARKSRQQAQD